MRFTLLILAVIATSLLAACAPGRSQDETSRPNVPEIPAASQANVESVDVRVMDADMRVIQVTASGYLPDAGCTSIAAIQQERDGDVFRVSITTQTDPDAMCAQVLTPFEEVISLEAEGLAPGQYRVIVNGVETSFDLNSGDRVSFEQRLVAALDARDYETLERMMGDGFLIGYWQSEGVTLAAGEAVEQLRASLIASDAPIRAESEPDLAALLGMDPAAILGPEVPEVSAVLVSGMGAQGESEAILFITTRPEGGWLWHGLLFAMGGFEQY